MQRPKLSSRQGVAAASLSGHAEWLVFNGGPMTMEQIRDSLLEVTSDPEVLGSVLGDFIVNTELHAVFAPIVDALRMTDHDEARALAVAAWRRQRIAEESNGEGGFRL